MVNRRNYGIDLLRIIAMMMVVTLHVLGHGGILGGLERGSLRYMLVWFIETASFCSVNTYALISGYVGLNSKPRCSRLIMLWLQVVFYTILITFIFTLKQPDLITSDVWKRAVFPVFTKQYWYITGYFGLYLVLPCIHWVLAKVTLQQVLFGGCIGFVAFSVIPSILQSDPFNIAEGYSMLWLCILYLAGACMKKFELFANWKKRSLVLAYLFVVFLSWGSKLVLDVIKAKDSTLLLTYISPTVVIMGISLVALFSKMNISNRKILKLISMLSPTTLGVYIIHEHFLIKENFINGISINYAKAPNSIIILLEIIFTVFGIFVCCSCIEWVRIKLFTILQVENKCKMFDEKIKKYFT